jgi:hypothetical protein
MKVLPPSLPESSTPIHTSPTRSERTPEALRHQQSITI